MSDELAGVLDGLLKMQAQERFQSADEVLAALNAQASAVEYERKLVEYEVEFGKMVASQWPLSSYLNAQLERLRAELGVRSDDVARVEGPIRDRAEAEYQGRLRRQAEERKREKEKVEALQRELEIQQRQETLSRDAERWQREVQETTVQGQEGVLKGMRPSLEQSFQEDIGNGVILEMVVLPEGRFLMGSPDSEEGRFDNEGPQREVSISVFSMGKYPVTQVQYEAVMVNSPSRLKGANRPVEQVSWNDAEEFCQKLSELSGKDYRLPSEAEWEYACRAGTTTPYFFGTSLSKSQANFSSAGTVDVGCYPANDFGLYDMHGNEWEWCLDHWHASYEEALTDGSAWVTGGNDELRILRGGSWNYLPAYCRSARRYYYYPRDRFNGDGFRVVCALPRTS